MDESKRSEREEPSSLFASTGTLEAWAEAYVRTVSLSEKVAPPPPPSSFGYSELDPPLPRDLAPGRPAELRLTREKPKSIKLSQIQSVEKRAELIHKFWHHELQAAELMCWAALRFPDAPLPFRLGLFRIARDEIRHMSLYEEHLSRLGFRVGDFKVRDWFWERVPMASSPAEFVALIGMGLEGANLEHTERFATWFRTVGDERGAEIQDQVGREEVAHVRFAVRWFKEFTGSVDYEIWRRHLPKPMTPLLMKGKRLRLDLRRKAEFPEEFLQKLEAYTALPGSRSDAELED